MSYAISRRGVRTTAAIGAVSLGLLALSACEKPTPVATGTVHSNSASSEAACYADGKPLGKSAFGKCLTKKGGKTLKVAPGDKLRLGVEPDTAKDGWAIVVNGRPATETPLTKTYHSLDADTLFQQPQNPMSQQAAPPRKNAQISIVSLGDGGPTGVWTLRADRDA